MDKISSVIQRITKDPYIIIYWILKYSGISKYSDYVFLKSHWRLHMGYKLDLNHPKTFAEKLQWIKLYDHNPIYTTMVDKIAVKDYVESRIGKEYIIPTLAVWDNIEEIDLSLLPNRFVLKCTHDSGSVVICRDKQQFRWSLAKKKLSNALSTNYYRLMREWPYKNVKPRIIAEEYINDTLERDLVDYKFFCFNGNVAYCQVISDRTKGETIDFFDRNWTHQDFIGLNPMVTQHAVHIPKKPLNYEKMVEFASILSNGIRFVRVDFYNIKGRIYFGELTFFPANGMGCFTPQEWNLKLGDLIKL